MERTRAISLLDATARDRYTRVSSASAPQAKLAYGLELRIPTLKRASWSWAELDSRLQTIKLFLAAAMPLLVTRGLGRSRHCIPNYVIWAEKGFPVK